MPVGLYNARQCNAANGLLRGAILPGRGCVEVLRRLYSTVSSSLTSPTPPGDSFRRASWISVGAGDSSAAHRAVIMLRRCLFASPVPSCLPGRPLCAWLFRRAPRKEIHDVRRTRPHSASRQDPCRQGLRPTHAGAAPGDSCRAGRPRPAGLVPDRERQDRRLHAALPAAPEPAFRRRRHRPAHPGADADPRTGTAGAQGGPTTTAATCAGCARRAWSAAPPMRCS